MKQKRQKFQKQIRRQALQQIFRKKRQLCFNFNNNNNHKSQITSNSQSFIQQLFLHCSVQLIRYSQQLHDCLSNDNIEGILAAVKDSYYEMKKILIKGKESDSVGKCVGKNWFKCGFDRLLVRMVTMFEGIDRGSFGAMRKQIYRYAVMHFHLVLREVTSIGTQISTKQIFTFLFLSLLQLSHLPSSINHIILIITYLITQSKQLRHEFLFQNYKLQQQSSKNHLLSFEHIVYVIFQNRQKFRTLSTTTAIQGQIQDNNGNDDNQYNQQQGKNRIYHQIKINFLYLFREYGYEMKDMEKYVVKCKGNGKQGYQNHHNRSGDYCGGDIDIVYENSLRLHNYPSQIKLRNFLQKQTLAIITDTINSQRFYYLTQWPTSPSNQQSLSQCLQSTRLLLDYSSNPIKLIQSLQDQLNDIISLLNIHALNIQVKNQTLYLIDSIIYNDQENRVVEYLVRDCNLFEKLWSYQEQGVFAVKMNAVNNLLLSTAGFHAVNRYLSDIVITLHGTQKFISLTLAFINNYFINTKFDLYPKSRIDLLIQLLYSLPKQKFTVEDLQHQCYILSHLYDNGFRRRLPDRYEQWCKELGGFGKEKGYERQDQQSLYIIASKMMDIYQHYASQQLGHFMEYE